MIHGPLNVKNGNEALGCIAARTFLDQLSDCAG